MSLRTPDHTRPGAVDLEVERAALSEAKAAVQQKLAKLAGISGGGADELADEYIDAVVTSTIEKLQQELVVFGRIDDDHPWRIGLYGIDAQGDQLVVDWRAPFAAGFYQARFDEPLGLERRTTYVGAIDDLFVEEFATGEVTGTSPLMGELSRSRGGEMRAAVATLQSEQDELVRLDSSAKLVLRGGPGTGKTVVGLHRAAWLVYNDTSLTAGRILVIGPSDRFLRFVSAVLPTLGEARITQTTFDHLLGPSTEAGSDPIWLELLDRFEESMLRPAEVKLGARFVPADDVAELITRARARSIPWRDQRKVLVNVLANRYGLSNGEVSRAVKDVWPTCTTTQAQKKLRSRKVLLGLGADPTFVNAWLADPHDGAWADEVRARFEGVPASYGHVIVDEAQDLSLMQLRAVRRRATGLSLVGDDAQRSSPHGLGLREIGRLLDVEPTEMATAYRMSAEIADWLNSHADRHGIDAVRLIGIRPTGRPVRELPGVGLGAGGSVGEGPGGSSGSGALGSGSAGDGLAGVCSGVGGPSGSGPDGSGSFGAPGVSLGGDGSADEDPGSSSGACSAGPSSDGPGWGSAGSSGAGSSRGERLAAELRARWSNVAVIGAGDTWSHKGVEYDAVVVDRAGMTAHEVYLAASRAAHELVLMG